MAHNNISIASVAAHTNADCAKFDRFGVISTMGTHFFAAPDIATDRARRIEQLASEYTSKLHFRRPDYNIESFDAARGKQ
jgi:hypothetical protein